MPVDTEIPTFKTAVAGSTCLLAEATLPEPESPYMYFKITYYVAFNIHHDGSSTDVLTRTLVFQAFFDARSHFFLTNVEDVDQPNTMNAPLHSTRHTRAESTIEYKQEDHAGTLSLVAAGIILDRATEYWWGTLPNT